MKIQTFELTFSLNCNFSCKYCYETHKVNEISEEKVKEILCFIKDYQNKTNPYFINIFGGEPLLYKDIVKLIVDFFKDEPCGISIFTNGSLLDEDLLNFTYPISKFKYHFSLDGSPNANNACRVFKNNVGTFDIVTSKIQLYKDIYKIEGPVEVRGTITPENMDYLLDTFQYLVDHHDFRISYGVNRDANVWNKQNLEKYEKILQQAADFYIQHPEIWPYVTLFVDNYRNLQYQCNEYFCGGGKHRITIDHEGNFYPCTHFMDVNFKIGDIYNGIDYDGKNMFLLSQYHMSNTKDCATCTMYPHHNCIGQCVVEMMKFNLFNSSNIIVDKTICELNKINSDVAAYVKRKCSSDRRYWNLKTKKE